MYPKTTFTKTRKIKEKNQEREIFKGDSLKYTHLTIRDDEKAMYPVVEINMPYIIIYEMTSKKGDAAIYQEFSENNQLMVRNDYQTFSKNNNLKLHMHNCYELTYVISGNLTLKIEDEEIVYHAGDCCLCNKNIHHMETFNTDTEFVLFLISEEYVKDLCENNFFFDSNNTPLPMENIFDVFFEENKKNELYDAKIFAEYRLKEHQNDKHTIKIINHMIEEITEMQSGKSHMMKALFCRFFEALQNPEIYQEEIQWARLSNLENMVYQVAKAYRTKKGIFSRQEIESITGYQSDYVERVFKKMTGMTLLAYGKSVVVKKAADLLAYSDLSIGDICENLGYTNRNYFNKIFFSAYGMTPSEYRKNVQKNN